VDAHVLNHVPFHKWVCCPSIQGKVGSLVDIKVSLVLNNSV
jgi:hypothetical protein